MHHNPIHGLEHLPFDEAIREAKHLFGAKAICRTRSTAASTGRAHSRAKRRAGARPRRPEERRVLLARDLVRSRRLRCSGFTFFTGSTRSSRHSSTGSSRRRARCRSPRDVDDRAGSRAALGAVLSVLGSRRPAPGEPIRTRRRRWREESSFRSAARSATGSTS